MRGACVRHRFNPRLPGGRRPRSRDPRRHAKRFQSTPSGGKATRIRRRFHGIRGFQSTPSGGKATQQPSRSAPPVVFQSTPSGGKATRPQNRRQQRFHVSIHAFRGEGDSEYVAYFEYLKSFNPRLPGGRRQQYGTVFLSYGAVSIHAFRGGRRHADYFIESISPGFQSTPSGGEGDRSASSTHEHNATFQSTPSGGEGDQQQRRWRVAQYRFNPRLPGGKATRWDAVWLVKDDVSIHAFRGGRRPVVACKIDRDSGVSIHAFRGGRRQCKRHLAPRVIVVFQSTPSGGEGDSLDADTD